MLGSEELRAFLEYLGGICSFVLERERQEDGEVSERRSERSKLCVVLRACQCVSD